MKGFISNSKLVDESYKTDDLFNSEILENSIFERLYKISSSSLYALIGRYGSGKSTSLFHISSRNEFKESKWIWFDAWKYPERSDLWEGLILDFAEQIGKNKEKVVSKISNGSSNSEYIDIITDILSGLKLISGLEFIDKIFRKVFDKSPATRVFQLQNIFINLINTIKENSIYIVVEDIDRSGDKGLYFLETLKTFVKLAEIKKEVIIIIPISDINYYNNQESYLKCIDYVDFFSPKRDDFNKFLDRLIEHSALDSIIFPQNKSQKNNTITQLSDFFKGVLTSYPEISIRTIKTILRKANINYILESEKGYDSDFRVTICIETMKYIKPKNFNIYRNMFQEVFTEKELKSNGLVNSLLTAISLNEETLYDNNNLIDYGFRFRIINSDIAFPKGKYGKIPFQDYRIDDDPKTYSLCDFYFKN